jgi:hypothetical protein
MLRNAPRTAPVFPDPLGGVPGSVAQVEAVFCRSGRTARAGGEAVTKTRQFFKSAAIVVNCSPDLPKDKAIPSHTGNIDLAGLFLSIRFRSYG